MSTNDVLEGVAAPGFESANVDLIARLANELFQAGPGIGEGQAGSRGWGGLGGTPLPGAPSVPGIAGLAAVRSIPVQVPQAHGLGGSVPEPLVSPPATCPTPAFAAPGSAIDLPYADDLHALLAGVLPGRVGTSSSALPFAGAPLGSSLGVPSGAPLGASPVPSAPTQALISTSPQFYFLSDAPGGIQVPGRTDTVALGPARPPFDVNAVRRDFPILNERVNGHPLVWLDNAATTQKPQSVIDRVSYFYEHENSNIHRAAHELAARATDAYEGAREKARAFLNAPSVKEVVFVRGTTEAINLVAQSWGRQHIGAGDEIIVTWLEHHANIVPWQQLAAQTGAKLKVVPVDDDGQVLLGEYQKLLSPRTKLVSFTQVSNALGTITPAKQIIDLAHAVGAKVLLDGAQSVSHLRADVQALGCDWFVFSGHKVFGPTGIGVLWGREALLNATEPWQGGGNMIDDVTFEKTVYQKAPNRFEAGTGNIADAVGLGAALDYVTRIGLDKIAQYEHGLLAYATYYLKQIPGLRLIGTAPDKAGVISFVLVGHNTQKVGAALNREGVAVRSGHHCAQPILRRFGVEATVRPSLALYNTCGDIDTLVRAVHAVAKN